MMTFFLEHWQTSQGPWLILHQASDHCGALARLMALFESLAEADAGTIVRLHELDFIQTFLSLDLTVLSSGPHRLRQEASGWTWSCPAERWQDHAARLGPNDRKYPARWHQYFDQHPADDATVVLSVGEYPGRFCE
ncbi:MAG: hypothetical protein NXI04_16890 [Planctomycetaceae bacterium]|nr:hypothetical protein [Planctomycetaceae bacterium]